jgi:hypothetical protein
MVLLRALKRGRLGRSGCFTLIISLHLHAKIAMPQGVIRSGFLQVTGLALGSGRPVLGSWWGRSLRLPEGAGA